VRDVLPQEPGEPRVQLDAPYALLPARRAAVSGRNDERPARAPLPGSPDLQWAADGSAPPR
jgi:hypothetical protein